MMENDFDELLRVNVSDILICSRVVGRGMVQRRAGAIVNVASINSFGGQVERLNYRTSKVAILSMMRTLAIEPARFAIRVSASVPQLIDAPMVGANVPDRFMREVVRDRTPLGRAGRPEEVSSTILVPLSGAASVVTMTATTLIVDDTLTAGLLTSESGADASSTKITAT